MWLFTSKFAARQLSELASFSVGGAEQQLRAVLQWQRSGTGRLLHPALCARFECGQNAIRVFAKKKVAPIWLGDASNGNRALTLQNHGSQICPG